VPWCKIAIQSHFSGGFAMNTAPSSFGVTQHLEQSLNNLASIPEADYEGVIGTMEQMMEPRVPGRDAWFWCQTRAALKRRDYGPLLAFAACVDLQEVVDKAPNFIGEIASVTQALLLALGQDPTTLRPLPRTTGRPRGDSDRYTGKLLFQKLGRTYRDATIGIWLSFAPFTVPQLRRHVPVKYRFETGARKWLESRGRRLLRSLDRAWEDVYGTFVDKPGLFGFMPLARKVLSEWPDDALEGIKLGERRKPAA